MTDDRDPLARTMGEIRDEIDTSPDYRAQYERVRARLFGARAPESTTMIHHCNTFAGLLDYLSIYPDVVYADCDTNNGRYPRRAAPGSLWTDMRLLAPDNYVIQYGGEPLSFAQLEKLEATGQIVFDDTPTAAKLADGISLPLTAYEAGCLRLAIETEIAALKQERTMTGPVIHRLAALDSIRDRLP